MSAPSAAVTQQPTTHSTNMPSPTSTLHSAEGGEHPASSAVVKPEGQDLPVTDEKKAHHQHKSREPPKGVSGLEAPIDIPRWRFWAIFISLMFSIFLFALDQLIVATAIPAITARFNSLSQLSWLTSGFFLTLLAFNLLYSQWNQIFPSKHVMLFAVFIFEVGSLVCGVAPSMEVLILGRAIAGVGAAGIFSGGMIIIAELTPLHNRAQYLGLFGVCFAIASVIGPLVGGAFSDHVSWRWCFYINLPFGGLALGMLFFFQPTSPPLGRKATYKGYSREMFWQVLRCDWLGVAISMAWACCLILALQWGGVTKKWSDGSVIACLVMVPVLPVVFVLYEWWLGEHAMFKLKLLKRRSIFGSAIVLFNLFAVFMLAVYFLAIDFQAAYHSSATSSGVKLLPLILVQVGTLIISSRVIPLIGRFKWIIFAGPCFTALACGLLYTVGYGTPESHLYGFQVILGMGIGMCMQNSMLAVQFELKKEPWNISAGVGLVVFIGFAGRILGISLATSVFENLIQRNLHDQVPDLPEPIVQAVVNSATAIWTYVPENLLQPVLKAYLDTVRTVYIIGVPFSVIGACGALFIKNSKMQTKAEEEAAIAKAREAQALAADGGKAVPAAEGEEVREAESAEREAMEAQTMSAVNGMPEAAVSGGKDAQVLIANQEGKSPV